MNQHPKSNLKHQQLLHSSATSSVVINSLASTSPIEINSGEENKRGLMTMTEDSQEMNTCSQSD